DEQTRCVAVRIVTVGKLIQSQLFTDKFDVRFFSSEERPARPDVIFLRIRFEQFGRVMCRIDRDRNKEDILPHPITQKFLKLDQSRGLEWTVVLAGRVDKLERHNLTFNKIVVEANLLAVLRDQLNVWKVTST